MKKILIIMLGVTLSLIAEQPTKTVSEKIKSVANLMINNKKASAQIIVGAAITSFFGYNSYKLAKEYQYYSTNPAYKSRFQTGHIPAKDVLKGIFTGTCIQKDLNDTTFSISSINGALSMTMLGLTLMSMGKDNLVADSYHQN